MRPLSQDLRLRFLAFLDSGVSARAAGIRFSVPPATATRWASAYKQEGRCKPLPMGGDKRSAALEFYAEKIIGWVLDQPDITLQEIAGKLAGLGFSTSGSSISRLLLRHGYTHKKRLSLQRNRIAQT